MNRKQITKTAIALFGLGTVFASLPAMAVVRRDALNNIYVTGLTPGTKTAVGFTGTARTRNATADRCGTVRISPSLAYSSATSISLGGTASNIGSLPERTPGNCASTNGVYNLVNGPTESRFKDAIGAIYIQGLTANSDQVVTYPDLPVGRNVTANACGYFKITNSVSQPITNTTSIRIGSVTYDVSDIQTVINPTCRKLPSGSSVLMVPLQEAGSWTSPE